MSTLTQEKTKASSKSAAKSGKAAAKGEKTSNFRFFDNRQKYLLFVNTCSEKWVVADRVTQELANIHPRPPALRLFDAGVGDGTVLARVMRAMHARFPTMPFYITGKEISLEDVRLSLERMPDRFFEHPATVLVLTNMFYSEAPWLRPNSPTAAHEHDLEGRGAQRQLEPRVRRADHGAAAVPLRGVDGARQREDRQSDLRPPGGARHLPRGPQVPARFASSRAPARSMPTTTWSSPRSLIAPASPVEFKVKNVVAPLARAIGPGGRLIGIHSQRRRSRPGDHPPGLAGREPVP